MLLYHLIFLAITLTIHKYIFHFQCFTYHYTRKDENKENKNSFNIVTFNNATISFCFYIYLGDFAGNSLAIGHVYF